MKPANKPMILMGAVVALVAGGGCATSEVLSNNNYKTRTVTSHISKQVLLTDRLVAFGRPAAPIPNLPQGKVVIVGEQKSYVLTTGGTEMTSILTTLDPKAIQVESDMSFRFNETGYFSGKMKLAYAKLAGEHSARDRQYFLQSNAKDCTRPNDSALGVERYCFDVPIEGVVYPQVSNFDLIRTQYQSLTKPYPITIYKTVTTENVEVQRDFSEGIKTLISLPFAVAFDVVVIPVVLVGLAGYELLD